MDVDVRSWATPAGAWTLGGIVLVAAGVVVYFKYRDKISKAVADLPKTAETAVRNQVADAPRQALSVTGKVLDAITGGAARDAVVAGVAHGAGDVIDSASNAIGLPGPSQTIDDVDTCRMILGTDGWYEMSKRCTAYAAGMATWKGALTSADAGRTGGIDGL